MEEELRDYVTTGACAAVVADHVIPRGEDGKPKAGHALRLAPRRAHYYLAQGMIEEVFLGIDPGVDESPSTEPSTAHRRGNKRASKGAK